jgi:integrase/recombinase XerD
MFPQLTVKKTYASNSDKDIYLFFNSLKAINHRDWLIARVILETGCRITEVLGLLEDSIDFNNGELFIKHNNLEIIFKLDESLLLELKSYIFGPRSHLKTVIPYVFITSNGRKITRSRLNHSFLEASLDAERLGLINRVSPDLLKNYSESITDWCCKVVPVVKIPFKFEQEEVKSE